LRRYVLDRVRILIADDHELVRQGLKAVLEIEDGIEIVGEASSGRMAIDKALELNPDVILLDLRLPDIDGVEVCAQIKQAKPDVKVVILTTFDEAEDIQGAMRAGASSYILKDIAPSDLVQALDAINKGKTVLDPGVADKLLKPVMSRKAVLYTEILSDRELEVLELMAEGMKNKEIAERLWISQTTVKTHVSHILQKLGQSDRTQAILRGIRLGLVEAPARAQ
jgi:DNA-binding NarL/FixJ family response regulator